MDDPRIEVPTDAIIKITTSATCDSDLNMYEGRTGADPGMVFGHENMGIVQEVGAGVGKIEKGDWIVLPCNAACSFCRKSCGLARSGSWRLGRRRSAAPYAYPKFDDREDGYSKVLPHP